MNKIDLVVNEDNHSYSQIYQEVDVKFSFLKETDTGFRELFPRVLCRDYLTDCVLSSKFKLGKVKGIYGFSLQEPIDRKRTLISVLCTDPASFLKGLRVIRDLERSFKGDITPLKVYETQHQGIFVIEADKAWQTSSLTISLFTYIIRIINYARSKQFNKIENLLTYFLRRYSSGNDVSYTEVIKNVDLRTLLATIDDVLGEHRITGFDDSGISQTTFNTGNDPDDEEQQESNIDLYSVHNGAGILSFAKAVSKMTKNTPCTSMVCIRWASNFIAVSGAVDWSIDPVQQGDLCTYISSGVEVQREIVHYNRCDGTVILSKRGSPYLQRDIVTFSANNVVAPVQVAAQ